MVLVKAKNPVLNSPFCEIILSDSSICKVDPCFYVDLFQHRWTTHHSLCRKYAIRKYRHAGRQFFVLMHRFIAKTPVGMICHHINGDSLDNRIDNLENMSDYDHLKRHSYR